MLIQKHVVVFTFPSIHQQTFSQSAVSLPVVFTVPPSFHNFLPAFAHSPSTYLHPKPPLPLLSVSLPPSLPPRSLSMDNSSVFLRAAVCLPAYCDFHWDSFRDHSHLSWELEARLWREINHSHLILTRIHKHTRTHTWTHTRIDTEECFTQLFSCAFNFNPLSLSLFLSHSLTHTHTLTQMYTFLNFTHSLSQTHTDWSLISCVPRGCALDCCRSQDNCLIAFE